MIEIEVRARCDHVLLRDRLAALSATHTGSSHEHDEYFKFGLDVERKLVLRIRRKANKTLLTFKGSSKLPDDVAWQEWETEIQDADNLEKLLLSNGLVRVVTIDKYRETFRCEDLEINLDRIAGLGDFIEVEALDEDASRGRTRVEAFLEKLGIGRDAFVTKGYVPLLLERQKA